MSYIGPKGEINLHHRWAGCTSGGVSIPATIPHPFGYVGCDSFSRARQIGAWRELWIGTKEPGASPVGLCRAIRLDAML